MKSLLSVEQFLENRQQYYLVDVRSPGEFTKSSIPGAVNVPLFSDEERAEVGTAYWQEGADRAKLVGLSLVSSKLSKIVEDILEGAAGREIVLYCWRGGMRSRSVFSLLEALGYPVRQLVGGYKAFRRRVVAFFKDTKLDLPVYVLNGLTGVGKTLVIKKLLEKGAPALDLEGMANHRGSAFGAVGLGQSRSQKDFEALLFLAMYDLKNSPFLIVEGEGKRIGPVVLPDMLFAAMHHGHHILLEAGLDTRVERIVTEYHGSATNRAELADAVYALQQKLGREQCEELAGLIRRGEYLPAAQKLCTDYYDLYYRDSRQKRTHYLAVVNVDDLDKGIAEILDLAGRSLQEKVIDS
ncbi:MAG: tRNA 2-selenouridine(34) synthase MnmH [Bacillota bacterium]|nr:tRNA 2-selenouridine(34) synthase MnmH [Bacillota bacterium]MDW7682902.1 tRNA 2-selenouridine(34) synthase MnmH [Bacillota bacterium]